MNRAWVFLLFAALGAAGPGFAQDVMSAPEILRALTTPGAGATRGIAPPSGGGAAAPQPSIGYHRPMPAGMAVPPMPPPPPSVDLLVNFETGSDALTAQAIRALEQLGAALTDAQLNGVRFRIEGHTDRVGDRAYNQALSERRARAVVQYLNARFKIPESRLEPFGFGEDRPYLPTADGVAEPRNRRVQVVRLGWS